MRIFVLLSRIPYPTEKGDKLRAYNQLKQLHKKHEIILCALNDESANPDAYTEIIPFVDNIHFIEFPKIKAYYRVLKALFGKIPLQVGYFYSKKTHEEISRLIDFYKPDHIYAQLTRVSEFVKNQPIPKTIDYQDAFSENARRRAKKENFLLKPMLYLESKRLKQYEGDIFDYFDHKTIISVPDQQLINHPQKNEIIVVPNGVDFEFFSPKPGNKKTMDLAFIGNMNYAPNVLGCEFIVNEILPIVKKSHPNIKLLLSGASPHRKVKKLHDNKNVFVTGWVNDIRQSYACSKIFLAPMQIGSGLQNKLLEAMAMKIPCITSPLANKALKATDGQDLLVGNSPEEYAQHIISLLSNEQKSRNIAENGHLFVTKHFNWGATTEKLIALIESSHSQDPVLP